MTKGSTIQLVNIKKELKQFYQPSAKAVVEVMLPSMNFLMIDGEGDPNSSQAYKEAVEALFSVSYTIKFIAKKGALATDYGVMPLEGLWWADDMDSFLNNDRSKWKWTMMIMQPSFITNAIIADAMADVGKKKNLPALGKLRAEQFAEGLCAQILHVGPFTEEGPTIEKVHQHIGARGEKRGKHHEIYLTDIRRADPAKWKTIIRQPFAPITGET